MYTDLSKIKPTDIPVPKGSNFYLLKDGRLCIYTYISLHIYNMTTFKTDLTLDNNSFPSENNELYANWGELVCLTELKNGYLVLGFGKALDFTNLIIDISNNNPKLIHKFKISNEDFCCREIINFQIGDKDYFIAGDYHPEIYNSEKPFNIITFLDIYVEHMLQIKGTNLLVYIENNKLNILDLTEIEKNKKGEKITCISFEKEDNRFIKMMQINDEIVLLGQNTLYFVNLHHYKICSITINKNFYNINTFDSMCKLFNNQLLIVSSLGDLYKIDVKKKEILQKITIDSQNDCYYNNCFAYKDKFLIFTKKEKLYEIKYEEKEEIKNYIETKAEITEETFMKKQDDLVKKIIEEKDLKKEELQGFCRPPYIFYYLYRFNSMKKEFPKIPENKIFSLCMKEYQKLRPENRTFFKELSEKDNYIH